jgi:hypothetical protein
MHHHRKDHEAMSPKPRGDYKPPRARKEIVVAVMAAVSIVVATGLLVWFLRPNRDSGSSGTTTDSTTPVATSTTVAGETTTTVAGATDTTAPPPSTP